MKNVIKSAGNRFFAFDTESKSFELGGCGIEKKFLLAEFLRFSDSRPWSFPVKEYDSPRVAVTPDDPMLIVAVENDCFLCGMAFNFDGELLRGDFFLSVKKDLPYNFVALALPVCQDSAFTLPGVLYNDNPSTPPEHLVAHFPAAGTASLMVEESRLPVTGVNAEKDQKFFSLFSVPEMEFEWTLGAHRDERGETSLMLGSGCVSFNGIPDQVYIAKRAAADPGCVYRNFQAGDRVTKRFALSWGEVEHKGHGFRDLIGSGFKLLAPVTEESKSREEIISLKMQALKERWAGNGYVNTMPDNLYRAPQKFLYGWTGQSFRLALCDLRYALLKKEEDGIKRMQRCVAFFLQNSKTSVPGLRNNYFDLDTLKWHPDGGMQNPRYSSRALGETWSDLARIISCCRENNIPEPEGALEALREGLQFFLDHRLPGGAVPLMWNPDGTPGSDKVTCAGSSVLPAFFEFFRLTGESVWRENAEKMLDIFYQVGGNDFATPFSHATLDAACEDKEACVPFFNAAVLAYEITGDEKYKKYADVAADWLLTWVYFHEVPFRPGSVCAVNGFRTTGWPTVSVEHHHLDVFFPAWELYRYGKLTNNALYRHMGKTIFAAWGYSVSRGTGDWLFHNPGRQPEQFFQTRWYFTVGENGKWANYHPLLRYQLYRHGYNADNLVKMHLRGGCNPWDVAWIIAMVLEAALGFEEEAGE